MNNLEKIPKKPPFRVPDDYFNQFPERLEQRLETARPARTPVIRQLRPVLSYAAMFIGLLTIGYLGMRYMLNQKSVSELSMEELAQAVDYYAHSFDNATILDAYLEAQTVAEAPQAENAANDVTEEMIEYLSDEPIDLVEYFAE